MVCLSCITLLTFVHPCITQGCIHSLLYSIQKYLQICLPIISAFSLLQILHACDKLVLGVENQFGKDELKTSTHNLEENEGDLFHYWLNFDCSYFEIFVFVINNVNKTFLITCTWLISVG